MSGYSAMFTCDREDRPMVNDEATPAGWLTTDEVASLAKCSPDTVLRAIRTQKIKRVKVTSGGMWLINLQEGITWAHRYEPYSSMKKREEDP